MAEAKIQQWWQGEQFSEDAEHGMHSMQRHAYPARCGQNPRQRCQNTDLLPPAQGSNAQGWAGLPAALRTALAAGVQWQVTPEQEA